MENNRFLQERTSIISCMKITPLLSCHIPAWAELLAICFARQPQQMCQLLTFLQPEKQLLAWGAWHGEQLVAQYSIVHTSLCLPLQSVPITVGLSVNMAVHPAYRGQGLVKQVSSPVYEALAKRGGVAGIGFSNAAGVKVDKHSQGYGYRVVGQMKPTVAMITHRFDDADLQLTTDWPKRPFAFCPEQETIHFKQSMQSIYQRFAMHPFRTYHFGIWQSLRQIHGLVVYRYVKLRGLPGVALLAAYANDLELLLQRWVTAVSRQGIRLIHLLSTPNAHVLAALRKTAVCLPAPINRTPYYLTAKPLSPDTPQSIFNYELWDCTGGDIL
jgi:hypothetical protein